MPGIEFKRILFAADAIDGPDSEKISDSVKRTRPPIVGLRSAKARVLAVPSLRLPEVVFSGTTDSQGKVSTGKLLATTHQQTGTDPTKIITAGSNTFTVTVTVGTIKKSQVIQLGLSKLTNFIF